MDIFLVCHAAAEEAAERDDRFHSLTAHGREQAKQLGDRLRWLDCHPSVVWTSPYTRSLQTAEILVEVLGTDSQPSVGPGPPITIIPALSLGGAAREVIAAIATLPSDSRALLVGHPLELFQVATLLVGDLPFSAIGIAEAVRLVHGRMRWRLAWDAVAPTA